MGSGGRPSAALCRAACCWVLVDMPTVQMCGWHTAAAAGAGEWQAGSCQSGRRREESGPQSRRHRGVRNAERWWDRIASVAQ